MLGGWIWLVATLGDTFLRPDSQGNVFFVSPQCFGALQLWVHFSSVRISSLQSELGLGSPRPILGFGDCGQRGHRCLGGTLKNMEPNVQGKWLSTRWTLPSRIHGTKW